MRTATARRRDRVITPPPEPRPRQARRPSPVAAITRALRMTDFLRRSPARLGDATLHKEWQHFIVYAGGLEVIINTSLLDDAWAGSGRAAEVLRLIVMVRAPLWQGRVDTFDGTEFQVADGGHNLVFKGGNIHFRDGIYHVDVTTADGALAVALELVPASRPAIANNQSLSAGRTLRWLFVPSLICRGTVRVGRVIHRVDGARAYHDHNWGSFRWGDDFSWEWGSAQPSRPSSPWSLVFMRMGNRDRTVTRCQGLYLWRGERPWRIFRDDELEITVGFGEAPACETVLPPIMSLLSASGPMDVPGRFEITARGRRDDGSRGTRRQEQPERQEHDRQEHEEDALHLRFHPSGLARVMVPSEVNTSSVTTLNEVAGTVVVSGRVRGVTVDFKGPGVFEFVRN